MDETIKSKGFKNNQALPMSHDKYSFQKKASSMNGMTRLTGKLLCYSLFLIPLTSSVHTLIPIPLTRVLVLLIFLLLVSYLLKKKSKTSFVLFLIDYLSFVFIYSIFYSISTIQENLEDFIYFSMAILVFVQACDKDFYGLLKKEIDQQKKVFKVIALLTFVINIVGFVLKKGTFESTGAFKGYTIVSHSIATIFVYEMAVFYNGIHIGAVSLYLNDDRSSAEFGWMINKRYHGQGFATEAAKALLDYGRHNIGIKHFIAHCDTENVSSKRVMEKLGMKCTGEFGGRRTKNFAEERREYLFEL